MSRSPSSRQRYLFFVKEYKRNRLEQTADLSRYALNEASESTERATFGTASSNKEREYLYKYLRWLQPHINAVANLLLLALAVTGLEILAPLLLRYIIDQVLMKPGATATVRMSHLNLVGGMFIMLVLAQNMIGGARDYRQLLFNSKLMIELRRSLFERLLNLPLPKLWDMKIGGILSRLSGDVEVTTGLLQLTIVSPTVSVVRLIGAVAVLIAVNQRLAMTMLGIIPGAMASSLIVARRIHPIYRSIRRDAEVIDGRAGEVLSGIRIVRTFRKELSELLDYVKGRHAVLRKELFAERRQLVILTAWNLLMGFVHLAIVWYGGHLYLLARASIGDIMAFECYIALLLSPVWGIVNSFSELQRSLAAMERVFEILEMKSDKPDKPDASDAPRVVEEIRFENVVFEYLKGRPVVRDFNVVVPSGSLVALVGRSGAGKTTVTDLVARFHDPTRGRILLNGKDIRNYRVRSYRSLLAIVQQDVFLFDGSVRENIAYARHDASSAEIHEAARRAHAHEFIVKLPEEYETFIGERGIKLSGGQQQRLAIARAILAAPQILILDEATSNLDTESERLIQASMATLLEGRTTFVIAHRLSTVRRANMILLIDDGCVVEEGTHDVLMNAHGLYYDMVVRQTEFCDKSGQEWLRA
jgi:ATP-binding cassette subfamily B protein